MSTRNQNIWIPFADIMTALMLIFLLIVVLIFSTVLQKGSPTEITLKEFEVVLDDLYDELHIAFADKRDEWGVRISDDLTIKFENPQILFDQDSSVIKEEFKVILDEFVPTYLSIVNKEKYHEKIKEIKIEGHTASPTPAYSTYIETVTLSQNRARNILEYILEHSYFKSLTESSQKRITFLLSANGFGHGRAIDSNNRFVYNTGKLVSPNSRRVEFRIVTNSDELVKQLVGKR